MIGNNACGSRALAYGRTSDNVVGLDVVTGSGARLRLGPLRAADARRPTSVLGRARRIVDADLGDDPHRVRPLRPPGLRLLPGAPAARARVRPRPGAGRQRGHARPSSSAPPCAWSPTRPPGSWSSSATPRWPTRPTPHPGAPAAPAHRLRGPGLPHRPRVRDVPAAVVPDLPRGRGLAGRRARRRRRRRAGRPRRARGRRRRRAGLTSWSPTRPRRPPSGGSARTAPGSRRAPRRAPRARRAGRTRPSRRRSSAPTCASFEALLAEHGLQGVPYGHFGDGCVHVRIDFPFGRPALAGDGGRAGYRAFVEAAAGWWPRYGGSLSGEHGDGRARSELLPADVLRRRDRAVRAGQGPVRPRGPAQPRRARAPGPAGRRRPASPPSRRTGRAWPWPTRTTGATSPPRSTAAPASASAAPT